MNREVTIISPEIAAGTGGLADYTLRIVEEWRDLASVSLIIPANKRRAGQGKETARKIDRTKSALRQALPSHGGAALLQYSAYGYDDFGYPRWLLRGLNEWKRRTRGTLVIMFHEIWTFWPVLNKNYLVQQLHRRGIRALLANADVAFTSTANQAGHLRTLVPGAKIEVLPVGSNVRRIDRPMVGRRNPGVAVLFGLQATRLRVLREMMSGLKMLSAEGLLEKIILIGAGDSAAGRKEERRLLEDLQLPRGFEQRGAASESAISHALLEASFGLSVQDELSLTKSGTFMAYSAHGLNVISTHVDAVEPGCWLISSEHLRRGISPNELTRRATALQKWQEQTASWTQIAARLANALGLSNQAVVSNE